MFLGMTRAESPLDWGQDELAMMAYIAAPSLVDDPERAGRDMILMFNSTGKTRDYKMPSVGRGNEMEFVRGHCGCFAR